MNVWSGKHSLSNTLKSVVAVSTLKTVLEALNTAPKRIDTPRFIEMVSSLVKHIIIRRKEFKNDGSHFNHLW